MCKKIENDEEKAAYVKARHWDTDLAYVRDYLDRAWLSAELRIAHKAFLFDQAVSQARERFGDATFESAFVERQKMSLDEALDLALKIVEEI